MPRTITVASQKGGVGKTTTAVNLATSLSLAGHSVLLIDLDPQSNATSGVGLDRASSPDDLRYLSALRAGKTLERYLRETPIPGLCALPSSPECADLELVHDLIASPAGKLRQALSRATKDFEYVLIDCPPSLQGPPTIALHLCDSVIVPIQCEYYAMEGLSQILPVIQKVQDNTNRNLQIEGLLLTMFSPDLELSRDVVDEITTYFPGQAFRTVVPRDVTLAEASSHGQPAIQYDPSSKGAWSYLELAREVMAHG
ncbi:MAG TPA: ParA family protein [Planctomycetota bacterium]|nr:ParA family protein [Planctomycetota bacterium]